jgi:histidinol-phosphate aminotransferase
MKVNKSILSIKPYKGGESKVSGVKKIIKLSSNENALGCSKKAIKAYEKAAKDLARYPDGSCLELRRKIADTYNLDPDRIVCGSGSDELIGLLVNVFTTKHDEVLYSEHGFLMYQIYALVSGAKAVAAKEIDMKTSVKNMLAKITNKTKIIFIANPNNPTGSYLKEKELRELIKEVPSNIMIVIDAAYAEYVEESDYTEGVNLVDKFPNVIMTRTFSKIYGLAALRLGWCYTSLKITDILNRVRSPFNVTTPAQCAGIAALGDQRFIAKSRLHNNKWLKIMREAIDDMGLKAYDSVANFILVEFTKAKAASDCDEFLRHKGIIVRDVTSYGLRNHLRITIGTETENKKLLDALNKFMNQ